MLLTSMLRRIRAARDDEQGLALPTAFAVMAILLIVAIAVGTAAVGATAFTTTTRADVQAHAAADAAIDLVGADLRAGKLDCSAPVVNVDSSNPDDIPLVYSAPVAYYSAAGVLLSGCGNPAGVYNMAAGTPSRAIVTATGRATTQGTTGPSSSTVIGIFDIVFATTSINLDKEVFSDAGYTLTNNTLITDSTGQGHADIYTNGAVDCETQSAVQGSLFIQGNITSSNGCKVQGTVWTGGSFGADSSQTQIAGDLLIAGGAGPTYAASNVNSAWVGGSVVANGNVSVSGNGNQRFCTLSGKNGNVCGSVVSIAGTASTSGSAFIGGNVEANGDVSLDLSSNDHLAVGGNVVSTNGKLSSPGLPDQSTLNGWSTKVIGGYVAVSGTSAIPKNLVSNVASSCSTSTTLSVAACTPANPPIPLGGLPAQLNFPTNTTVPQPPRESLPYVTSDATAQAQWVGQTPSWTVQKITGCDTTALGTAITTAASTGRKLIIITGCTAPIAWDNKSFAIPGDVAIMSPAGFKGSNNDAFTTTTGSHQLMLIVPSDSTLGGSSDPLVTWLHNTIPTDPNYVKPQCNGTGGYGNISFNNLNLTGLTSFIYTPCSFTVQNGLSGFSGQLYVGAASLLGNNNSLAFTKIPVPSASMSSAAVALGAVTVTETARFDQLGGH